MIKTYLLSLCTGLIVGMDYSLIGVRSPEHPVIALVGLAGILVGEQIVLIAKRISDRAELTRFVRDDSAAMLAYERSAFPPSRLSRLLSKIVHPLLSEVMIGDKIERLCG